MKKIIAIALCVVMCFSMLCIASAEETTKWELKDGLLTISGSGVIGDFKSETEAPWYDKVMDVKKIVVNDGITRIGDYAFYGCSSAESIEIPNSVESIGINALSYTEGSVTSISNVNAPFQFIVKSDNKFVKKGEEFYITVDLKGDFKNVSAIQGILVFDSKRVSASEEDWCDKEWLESVDETNLGYISDPASGIVNNTVRFIYISMSGYKIDKDSPLFNAGVTTLTAAKLKFTALEDIADINTTCFNLKESKVVVTDEKLEEAEASLVQLTNTTVLPISNLTVITDNDVAKEYAVANGIKALATDGSEVKVSDITPKNEEKAEEPAKVPDEITVTIDGKKIEFDVNPILMNDRTLVPMRKIFEELGAVVTWDNETETAFGTDGKVVIAFQINNNIMTKSAANAQSEVIELDVPAQLINDRTLVPIRAISESFGCNVDWVDATQTVVITTK